MCLDLQQKICYCALGSNILKATDLVALVREALKPRSICRGIFSCVTLPQSHSQLFMDGLAGLLPGYWLGSGRWIEELNACVWFPTLNSLCLVGIIKWTWKPLDSRRRCMICFTCLFVYFAPCARHCFSDFAPTSLLKSFKLFEADILVVVVVKFILFWSEHLPRDQSS